jgi:hypothetical protein
MSDGCDLVYMLLIERLERHVLNERQVAVLAQLGGAKQVTVPEFGEQRTQLDRLLGTAPRRQYPPEQAAMIAALGLGDGEVW